MTQLSWVSFGTERDPETAQQSVVGLGRARDLSGLQHCGQNLRNQQV